MSAPFHLAQEPFTLDTLESVLSGRPLIVPKALATQLRYRRALLLERLQKGEVIYGVNTGLGYLKGVRLSTQDLEAFQKNILLTHAAGWGAPLPDEVVRATLALWASSLAHPETAISVETLNAVVALFNSGIIPEVPAYGSVGASGDLIPLAHLARFLTGSGRGKTLDDTAWRPAKSVLRAAHLKPVSLGPKETLSLINGLAVSAALLGITLLKARRLLLKAELVAALSSEVLLGSALAYRPEVARLKRHPRVAEVAERLTAALKDSKIVASHAGCNRIQDAYSLRALPQVFGALWATLDFARGIFENEAASVADNPVVLNDGTVAYAAHFHGEPLSLALNSLNFALFELARFSEKRIERLLDPALNEGLPPFLGRDKGKDSGFMMAQYLTASLLSSMAPLVSPPSLVNVGTSAGQEDFNSFCYSAGLNSLSLVDLCTTVIAVEALLACEAADARRPLSPGAGTRAFYEEFRARVPVRKGSEPLSDLIALARSFFASSLQIVLRAPGTSQ
jgi:histidine ammonia-lyase